MNNATNDELSKREINTLYKSFQKGDISSFEKLYNLLKKPVFVIIFRIVLNRELAEDLTHDLFVKLFVSPLDSSVSNFKAYIFQMGRNLAIDALKIKENRYAESIEEKDISDDGELESFIFSLDVEKAMTKLSLIEREIVSLHLNGDLTFFEISKILNLSLSMVYRKYSKAIKALRDDLNGDLL